MSYAIHRIREEDWERLREIRLAMLRDTPTAFLESYAQALGRDEADWRMRARRCEQTASDIGFAALDQAGAWVGTMRGYIDPAGDAVLISAWVHPDHRGREHGVAGLLLAAIVGWARQEAHAARLKLLVHQDNARAQAFYRREGFTETGVTVPYELDPIALEHEMARPLDDPASPPG